MKPISICVLVVVFGKDFRESKTLDSLKNVSFSKVGDFKLVVWNNDNRHNYSEFKISESFCGCKPDSFDHKKNIEVINSKVNYPLSKLYNKIASVNKSKYDLLILLDDDSKVPVNFFDKLCSAYINNSVCIKVPKAYSVGTLISPTRSNLKRIESINSGVVIGNDLSAIGSGLTIPTYIFSSLIFDENLDFYGVDHDFVTSALRFCGVEVVDVEIEHSLSTDSSDLKNFSDFKIKSLIYSMLYNGRKHGKFINSLIRASKFALKLSIVQKRKAPIVILIRKFSELFSS